MTRTSVAAASVLGSAALVVAALTGSPVTASARPLDPVPAPVPPVAAGPNATRAPAVSHSTRHGHPTTTFHLARSAASVAKSCLLHAKATVMVEHTGEVDIMRVAASGLPKKVDFDFFVLQAADAPFGLSWYQGDLESNRHGNGHVTYIGRFNPETFSVATGPTAAPVVHSSPIADADKNPVTAPIHQYHLGFWFNSPKDAASAGCLDATTPFNGEHTAGVQAMSTRQFPALAGPLSRVTS